MPRRKHVLLAAGVVAVLLLSRPARSQGGPGDTVKPCPVKLPGLQIDLEGKRVVGKAVVVLREGPLELFACAANTKEHESILAVRFVPSQLHMALLAIGLKPGHPISYDTELQKYLPACGHRVKIRVRWRDETGREHINPITDWMVNSKTNKTMAPRDFIFAGSVKLPDGRYLADLDGTVITVANFASSVLDIPGRYSTKNELLVWAPKTDAIPPVGTEVELVFSPGKMAARPAIVLSVDRFGRYFYQSRRTEAAQLSQQLRKQYLANPDTLVRLQVQAETLRYDVQRMLRLIGGTGLYDVEVTTTATPKADPAVAFSSIEEVLKRYRNVMLAHRQSAEAMQREHEKFVETLKRNAEQFSDQAEQFERYIKRIQEEYRLLRRQLKQPPPH